MHFVFKGLVWISMETMIIYLNRINRLIFAMEKCHFFEVRTGSLRFALQILLETATFFPLKPKTSPGIFGFKG
jgi:hypothetical protein